MSIDLDLVLGWMELGTRWLEAHVSMTARLLALFALVLMWWRLRHREHPESSERRAPVHAGECKSCGEGYRLGKLPPTARDGAQMCVRCPTCQSWYAVATTSRDVFKVDEGYVSNRWPQALERVMDSF